MGGATAADYAWLRDRWTDGVGTTTLCINFVASLSPDEALRRFGVTPDTSGEFTIAAYEATGGTVLAETGWATGNGRQHDPLSARTKAATVQVDIKDAEFTFEVNNRLITTFSLFSYRFREGDDPDRFLDDVRALDLFDASGDLVPSALALASRATGVDLSRTQYARPSLTGSTDHLYGFF
ncbi:DUF6461 domain-containing protein [Microbispora sp. H10949]|uniref:DUF6461 domain-containing protein n=1 Tax=Microbispora sp. H10949 TaxID=2729111 RepID=UPI001601ED5A|nr:DUF6461 domain-containing protein [Microbispora sp. H10949]